MQYKVIAFITDGLGNVFIGSNGAMSERTVYVPEAFEVKQDSLSLPAPATMAIKAAFDDIARGLAVIPSYIENNEKMDDVRFCIIVAEEININKKILTSKLPFQVVLDQYTKYIKEIGQTNENIVMTNFLFDVSTKINLSSSANSAIDFVSQLSLGLFARKNLTCPICGSRALRESTPKPGYSSFIQEITCSNDKNQNCGISLRKEEKSADIWESIISSWESMSLKSRL